MDAIGRPVNQASRTDMEGKFRTWLYSRDNSLWGLDRLVVLDQSSAGRSDWIGIRRCSLRLSYGFERGQIQAFRRIAAGGGGPNGAWFAGGALDRRSAGNGGH